MIDVASMLLRHASEPAHARFGMEMYLCIFKASKGNYYKQVMFTPSRMFLHIAFANNFFPPVYSIFTIIITIFFF